MYNPFDLIIEKLDGLENKIAGTSTVLTSPAPEIISRAELCKRLNITEPTCIRWEKKGVLPCFRIGSSIRYNWPKVIEALENKKKGGSK
jgi:hypothetical protein